MRGRERGAGRIMDVLPDKEGGSTFGCRRFLEVRRACMSWTSFSGITGRGARRGGDERGDGRASKDNRVVFP